MTMTKKDKSFFRETNLWRLAGFALVIGGLFIPVQSVTYGEFSLHANFIQLIGGALIAYPMVIEILKTVFKSKSGE